MKLKKGDLVRIMAGKDKGREGKVERVWPRRREVLVAGMNQYKRHRKPQGSEKSGEIVTLARPLTAAKVALVCPKCKQVTRVGYQLVGDKKVRMCRKCDNPID